MSRVQVLDVGDQVTHATSGLVGVVVEVDAAPKVTYYTVDWKTEARDCIGRVGWSRQQLSRVGDDFQVGDWVKVSGRIEPTRTTDWTDVANAVGIIVDRYEAAEVDFVVAIPELNDLYECRNHLTRITRAEAML